MMHVNMHGIDKSNYVYKEWQSRFKIAGRMLGVLFSSQFVKLAHIYPRADTARMQYSYGLPVSSFDSEMSS